MINLWRKWRGTYDPVRHMSDVEVFLAIEDVGEVEFDLIIIKKTNTEWQVSWNETPVFVGSVWWYGEDLAANQITTFRRGQWINELLLLCDEVKRERYEKHFSPIEEEA